MALDLAGMQILPQPATAYLSGAAIKNAQAMEERQMALQERKLTAEENAGKAAAKAKFDEQAGKRAISGADQTLAVPKGKRKAFVERTFPELIPALSKSGYGEWNEIDEDELEELASGIKARAMADLGISPDKPAPLSTEGKVSADVRSGFLTPEQAAAATSKTPTSFDEYVAAQKDPEYRKFLEERRGKGISMTMPDGTVIDIGGSGGGISAKDLSAPTKNKLQEAIVNATDGLDRLNSIGQSFDAQFLTAPGKLKGLALTAKDLAGGLLGDLTPEESDYITKFTTFRADAAKNLNLYVKEITGAAMSIQEAERIMKGAPNPDDSPAQFIAKYKSAVKDASRAIMRANWALKNGIGVDSVDKLAKTMPLGSIDKVYEDRANELWQEFGATPEAKKKAITQANQEFGLGR